MFGYVVVKTSNLVLSCRCSAENPKNIIVLYSLFYIFTFIYSEKESSDAEAGGLYGKDHKSRAKIRAARAGRLCFFCFLFCGVVFAVAVAVS